MSQPAPVWLPYPVDQVGEVPDGVGVAVFDGSGDPPAGIEAVRFYVPPYMSDDTAFRLLRDMPALEVVQSLSAGYDDVLPYVPDGVVLCNARGVHDASTAELAVGLAVAALRGFPDLVRAQDEGRWQSERRRSLADRRVLLLGYGSIGAAVERRLAGFEVDVVRVARSARQSDAGPVHAYDELADLLPGAEVVVVTVPLTDDTRGMVGADFLARLPDGAVLVNVARGPVVDTDALLGELTAGRLLAALDVTDPEPLPPDHPLWRAPGAFVVPHVGGNTTAMRPRAMALLRAQLARWVAGEPLANVVRPA